MCVCKLIKKKERVNWRGIKKEYKWNARDRWRKENKKKWFTWNHRLCLFHCTRLSHSFALSLRSTYKIEAKEEKKNVRKNVHSSYMFFILFFAFIMPSFLIPTPFIRCKIRYKFYSSCCCFCICFYFPFYSSAAFAIQHSINTG